MKKKTTTKLWPALVVALVLIGGGWPQSAPAATQGACANCHTMHGTQGGVAVDPDPEFPGGNINLLRNDCIGCHSGMIDVPAVYDNTGGGLGGGNFYWVSTTAGVNGDDVYGHNVSGFPDILPEGIAPYGFVAGVTSADGNAVGTAWTTVGNELSCAGTYGCHGVHTEAVPILAMNGSHHKNRVGKIIDGQNDDNGNLVDTATLGGSFRFLQGIEGNEDVDWEETTSAGDHNQYKGVDGNVGADKTTISSLCAQCHGNYHTTANTQSTGIWIRHPSDFDLGNTPTTSEYRGYGGAPHTYNPQIPLGSLDVSVVKSAITFAGDDAIVTCLSCHRAHASPYYKGLRWDYTAAYSLGTTDGFGGCAICHTSKN